MKREEGRGKRGGGRGKRGDIDYVFFLYLELSFSD